MSFTYKSIQTGKLNLSVLILILFSLLLIFSSFTAFSKAKIKISNGHNVDGFAQTHKTYYH